MRYGNNRFFTICATVCIAFFIHKSLRFRNLDTKLLIVYIVVVDKKTRNKYGNESKYNIQGIPVGCTRNEERK